MRADHTHSPPETSHGAQDGSDQRGNSAQATCAKVGKARPSPPKCPNCVEQKCPRQRTRFAEDKWNQTATTVHNGTRGNEAETATLCVASKSNQASPLGYSGAPAEASWVIRNPVENGKRLCAMGSRPCVAYASWSKRKQAHGANTHSERRERRCARSFHAADPGHEVGPDALAPVVGPDDGLDGQ